MVTADEYVARIESAAFSNETWMDVDRAWLRAMVLRRATFRKTEGAWGRYNAAHAELDAKRERHWRVGIMLAKIRGLIA